MGAIPDFPSEQYGYIIPKENNTTSEIAYFKEKPTKSMTIKYIEKGVL